MPPKGSMAKIALRPTKKLRMPPWRLAIAGRNIRPVFDPRCFELEIAQSQQAAAVIVDIRARLDRGPDGRIDGAAGELRGREATTPAGQAAAFDQAKITTGIALVRQARRIDHHRPVKREDVTGIADIRGDDEDGGACDTRLFAGNPQAGEALRGDRRARAPEQETRNQVRRPRTTCVMALASSSRSVRLSSSTVARKSVWAFDKSRPLRLTMERPASATRITVRGKGDREPVSISRSRAGCRARQSASCRHENPGHLPVMRTPVTRPSSCGYRLAGQ